MKRRSIWHNLSICLIFSLCLAQFISIEPTRMLLAEEVLTSPDIVQTKSAEEIVQEELLQEMEQYLNYREVDAPSPARVEENSSEFPAAFSSNMDQVYLGTNISPVKNQGSFGTCWAFSVLSGMESTTKINASSDSFLDLSELHLAYFMYHTIPDPLGGTTGDEVRSAYWDYIETGGNSYYTMWSLLNWKGAENEASYPYPTGKPFEEPALEDAYNGVTRLKNVYRISGKDTNTIKSLIKTYGSISVAYYHDDKYYNPEESTYYCNQDKAINHLVSIVGWSDLVEPSNFLQDARPSGNGAWKVKNSWGTGFGDQGYFWISYEDLSLDESWYVFDAQIVDYDNNYQYDGGVNLGYIEGNEFTFSNIFEAKGREEIKAVGFYAKPSTYSISIYQVPANGIDPSGTKVYQQTTKANLNYEGFHTITLDQPVTVNRGERFSIVVEVQGTGNGKAVVPLDRPVNSWIISNPTSNLGESFYRTGTTGSWVDAHQERLGNIRLKAYSKNASVSPIQTVSLDQDVIELKVGQSLPLTAVATPAGHDDAITWSVDNPTYAMVSSNGLVTAKREGLVTVTAKSRANNMVNASCQVQITKSGQEVSCEFTQVPKKLYKNWVYTILPDDKINALDPFMINYSIKATNCTLEPLGQSGLGGVKLTVDNVRSQKGRGEKIVVTARVGYYDKKGKQKVKAFNKTVTAENTVTDIDLTYQKNKIPVVGLDKKQKANLTYTLNFNNPYDIPTNQKVKWFVTDASGEIDKNGKKVASVDGKGVVKFKGPGTTYIKAAAMDSYDRATKTYGIFDLIQVTCPPVDAVRFANVPSTTIRPNSSFNLMPSLAYTPEIPFESKNIKLKWLTSDRKIATVNKGVVKTGKLTGTVVITVQAIGGVQKGMTVPEANITLTVQ